MVQYHLWGTDVNLDLSKDTFPTDEEIQETDNLFYNCAHGYFQSPTETNEDNNGGVKLHYRKFTPSPDTPITGVCVFQHGIHAESGVGCIINNRLFRYALLSKMFAECGYILYALDLRGHGFSEGDRFYIPDSDWKVNHDDLESFALYVVNDLESDNSKLPFFLIGESYGGCLTLHIARKWMDDLKLAPTNFRGIALLAPAIIADLPPPMVVSFLTVLAEMFPRWEPFFLPNPVHPARLYKNETAMKDFCSDHRRIQRLASVGRKFHLGTALALVNSIKDVKSDAIPGLSVPFFVAHGTKDAGTPIEGTQYLLEHATTPEIDRCVRFVEDGFHDLLSDETKEVTVAAMIEWMNTRRWKAL